MGVLRAPPHIVQLRLHLRLPGQHLRQPGQHLRKRLLHLRKRLLHLRLRLLHLRKHDRLQHLLLVGCVGCLRIASGCRGSMRKHGEAV